MTDNERRYRILFGVVFAAAIFFRLVSWSGRTAIQTDSEHFIAAGVHLFRGEGLTDSGGKLLTVHPPVYAVLIGLLWKIVGDGEFAARLVSFISGLIVVIQIQRFAAFLWNRNVGLGAMALAAVYPSLVNTSTAALAESLTMVFVLAFLLQLAKTLDGWRPKHAMLAGLFAGLAGWTRSTATLRGWAAIVVLLAFLLPRKNLLRRDIWRATYLFAEVLIAVLLPLMFFYYQAAGKWTINPESAVWLQIELDWTDPVAYEEALKYSSDPKNQPTSAIEVFTRSPGRWVKRYLRNAYTFYKVTIPKEIAPLFLFFAGIGFLVPPARGYRTLSAFLPLLLPVFVWVLMRGTDPRDVVPMVPAVLMLSAAGMGRTWRWGRELDGKEGGWLWGRSFALFLILLALALCLPGTLKYRLGSHGQAVEHKLMGQWIEENVPKEDRRLLTRKPMVALYADGRSIGMTRGSLEDFHRWAIDHEARFLCVDDRSTTPVYPSLAPLMEEDFEPPIWLKFRHKVEAPDGFAMVLYELLLQENP